MGMMKHAISFAEAMVADTSSRYAVVMGIWEAIKAVFAGGASTPPDARRLSAVDEFALSACLSVLYDGERGWITLSEARALFSPRDEQYAFEEMDDQGRASLAAFAARSDDPMSILCQLSDGSTSLEERLDTMWLSNQIILSDRC
jgi:hypothetical protein